jgi:hypothetical protein
VNVTRWPDADAFPPGTPAVGIRADRHAYPGLACKIWVTAQGVETAIYRPNSEGSSVTAFLHTVRALASEELGSATIGSQEDRVDVRDAFAAPGGTVLESGLGIGSFGEGPFLSASQLAEVIVEDAEFRLSVM